MKLFNIAWLCIALLFSTFSTAEQKAPWLEKMDFNQYKNKVIYLDFWASWCGPCRQSFPWLNAMQTKYQDKGLVIIGINLDKEIQSADKFLNNVSANFLLYSDPTGELAAQYQLEGMPSSYLLTEDGNIHIKHVGFKRSKTDEYEASIVALLAQLPQNKG